MTSVLNRLLQLSGSKLKFSLLFYLMVILTSSCGIFKKTQKTEDEVIILQPNKSDSTVTDNKDIKDSIPVVENETKAETIKTKKSWEKKNSYNVAIILPFGMDAIELATLMSEEKLLGYQPLASIEFYEGALMALDSLKSLDISLNIFTYDDAKDDSVTTALFQQPEMKTMDIMIGPIFNQSLKIAAEFAKENEIFLISPLSPAQNITKENRYYITANATLKTQLQKTIEYFYQSDADANVIVVYRNDKLPEAKVGSEFVNFFKNDSTLKSKKLKEVTSASGITGNISSGVKNYIFIASTDELFVNGLVRDISKMSRGSENINIVGMPGMMEFESVSIDYYESLNFHYPTAYWVDANAPRTERFVKAFESKYKSYPSDYAFRGYDLTFYFGQMLKMFGPDIASNLDKNVFIKSPLYRFQFTPSMDENNKVKYYENENIVILKYDNYRFEKVN
ncbi:MAG: ABC transporter substrate-binding protein [Chitinophagales bacterium]